MGIKELAANSLSRVWQKFMKGDEDINRRRIRLIGIFATIPFVLAVPPVIGWYIGSWLDKGLGTDPYMMYSLLILGFIAGVREFYRIIKKYGNEDI